MRTIPYGHQSIDGRDINEVVRVLKSDWLTQGPKVKEFEDALCKYTGAKYAIAVSSGTAALHLACLVASIQPKDEVITSPITFVASANCVLYCGGKPVFADIQEDTINIDPEEVKKRITRETKAIIPVHFAGHPCDLQEINQIAKKHNLIVIEDAAHALGAEYKGSKIGSCKYSDMTIFSFHPVKAITTGEGGAILSNRRDLYERLIKLRNHGITKDCKWIDKKMVGCGWYYEMRELGFNYRLTDIQAALGVTQLKRLDYFLEKRRKIAKIYDEAFANNKFFNTPIEKKYAFSAYHLYPIQLKDKFKHLQKTIFFQMRDMGLGVQVHYIPVYLQPYYKRLGFKKGTCPNAEDFYNGVVSLPIYPALTAVQIKYVIDTVFKVFNRL
jgi:UDP-4-amino-4,6-dideoxy-N-acetyl-beta-L-altrosamine transaminase